MPAASNMDIADWRKQIDELDRKLVALINERAHCAQEIGRLKRNTQMPIYEPDREKIIFDNVQRLNRGPLPDRELIRIYERLIDVMRKVQLVDSEQKPEKQPGDTELEAGINE
jgi:chorismate mutase